MSSRRLRTKLIVQLRTTQLLHWCLTEQYAASGLPGVYQRRKTHNVGCFPHCGAQSAFERGASVRILPACSVGLATKREGTGASRMHFIPLRTPPADHVASWPLLERRLGAFDGSAVIVREAEMPPRTYAPGVTPASTRHSATSSAMYELQLPLAEHLAPRGTSVPGGRNLCR